MDFYSTFLFSELMSKAGLYTLKSVASRTILSAAYLGEDAVTGMIDGTYEFLHGNLSCLQCICCRACLQER